MLSKDVAPHGLSRLQWSSEQLRQRNGYSKSAQVRTTGCWCRLQRSVPEGIRHCQPAT
ncbi:TPA: hypothetical protein N0F65_011719 [Lagenidium giganteum]|uniref:Uncharacterized protein n=1 Tax=Lagenidium giganteum TaxID=4803 RepID=A0AAV2YBK2_9STRA|nr:TPA: hypothetical protein N0F65_011719 [Lagenidium giganteum]